MDLSMERLLAVVRWKFVCAVVCAPSYLFGEFDGLEQRAEAIGAGLMPSPEPELPPEPAEERRDPGLGLRIYSGPVPKLLRNGEPVNVFSCGIVGGCKSH